MRRQWGTPRHRLGRAVGRNNGVYKKPSWLLHRSLLLSERTLPRESDGGARDSTDGCTVRVLCMCASSDRRRQGVRATADADEGTLFIWGKKLISQSLSNWLTLIINCFFIKKIPPKNNNPNCHQCLFCTPPSGNLYSATLWISSKCSFLTEGRSLVWFPWDKNWP